MEVLKMLYSVIFKGLTSEDIQTIGKRINPPVLAKIGARLDAQETREAIGSLKAINNEALVIDLDAVDNAALIDTLHAYRVQRPETRIIIYAPGRCPGDLLLAQLVSLGIYDLVTPVETPTEDLAGIIVHALDAQAGTYATASRFSKTYVGQEAAPAGKGTPGKSNDNDRTVYVAHQLIAVWSPTGYLLAFTALNLAALAASNGFDTALINYDLNCPDLDYWFGVRQTGLGNFDDASAGMITFDDGCRPELVARFMKERAFGVKYLPAGNKLGKIGSPEIRDEDLEQILRDVCRRNSGRRPAITIVDAGNYWGNTWTLTALRLASVILVPTDGTPASAAVINQHVEELTRLEIGSRFIECCLGPIKRPSWALDERLQTQFEWQEYLDAAAGRKPMALRKECRGVWDVILNKF
jgi:hypothetical protein